MSRQVRFLLKGRKGWDQASWNSAGEKSFFLYRGAPLGTGSCSPTYLASRVRAMMPAANGAEAEVPV